jgi:hypothetical protein
MAQLPSALPGAFPVRPALIFSSTVASLVLGAACALAQDERPQMFISPMGEPFRAPAGQPYPSAQWFAQADANHDGVITREEFRADARRFFKVLDIDGNGMITDLEVQRYEYILAPEIVQATQDTSNLGVESGDPDSFYHHTALSAVKQGAANFGFLDDPEPVRSTDMQFNRKITLDEFLAAADRRYDKLLQLSGDDDGLKLADLPHPPNQKIATAKKGK